MQSAGSRGDLAVMREIGETGLLPSFRAFLSKWDQAFAPSQMYAVARETKFVDQDKRKSEFRTIRSEELFALAREYVQGLSDSDAQNEYMLVPNDITEVRYKPGGFFKSHTDFLSTTSNLIEEYTLLLCVTPDDKAAEIKGGATIIHGFGKSVAFGATTAPGQGLLFRKDLSHEGSLVEAGEKHVLSFNVWGLRKHTGQIVLVTFPGEHDASAASAGGGAAADMHAVSAGRWHAIRASDVVSSGGMLAKHLEWTNRSADEKGEPRPQIVRYCSEDFSFDQFATVFRLITRSYVTPEEFLAGSAAIKFFGPFKYEEFLVEFDTQAPALEALAPLTATASLSCAACGASGAGVALQRCSRCKEVCFCSEACFQKDYFRHRVACSATIAAALAAKSKPGLNAAVRRRYKKMKVAELKEECRARQLPIKGVKGRERLVELLVQKETAAPAAAAGGSAAAAPQADLDGDVIVCDSEERTAVLCEIARELHLDYVRFKILFAEGALMTGGDMGEEGKAVPMMPAWITVGDYENLFCSQCLVEKSDLARSSMQEVMQRYPLFAPSTLSKLGGLEFPYGKEINLEPFKGYGGDTVDADQAACSQACREVGTVAYNLLLSAAKDRAAPGQNTGRDVPDVGVACPGVGSNAIACLFEAYRPLAQPNTLLPGAEDYGGDADGKTASDAILVRDDDERDAAGGANGAREPTLYHRDSRNKVCFSKAEALAASEHIAAMKLDERVKACLQRRRFQLPQQRASVEAFWCNETVYGNLNVLCVTGVVKMDIKDVWTFERAARESAGAGGGGGAPFDVWPEESVKGKAMVPTEANAEDYQVPAGCQHQ